MQLEIACLFRPLQLTVGFAVSAVWIPKEVEDGERCLLLFPHVVIIIFAFAPSPPPAPNKTPAT